MKEKEPPTDPSGLNRRSFLRNSAITGGALLLSGRQAHAQTKRNEQLQVALVGCGSQGDKLYKSVEGIPLTSNLQVHFRAVCDIWDSKRRRLANKARQKGHDAVEYVDFEDLLEKEAGKLDAVFVASPDFCHHTHTNAALQAGLHVYCEKMMSNTIEDARSMVVTANQTGKLLQIGHQRRSNPRYRNLVSDLLHQESLLGRITHATAQWNRGVQSSKPITVAKSLNLDSSTLKKYGYGDMREFLNWRMFKRYGGGVISDLGAHQIDLFGWFLNAKPKSVLAAGGVNYWDEYELPDNVMAIYDFETPEGISRAYYQVLTTSSSLGFFERFMGDEGTVTISENPSQNQAYRESTAPKWDRFVDSGKLVNVADASADSEARYKWQQAKPWGEPPTPWKVSGNGIVDSRASAALEAYELGTSLDLLPHTPHVMNFVEAVKADDKSLLNCPGEEGYRTCVAVLSAYESMESGSKRNFSDADFAV
ncbi:MAG: Gfo/Idh/MocA family oxidoreductase [Verrucomicrobiota bacterium]